MTLDGAPVHPLPPRADAEASRREPHASVGRGEELEQIRRIIERRSELPAGIVLHGGAGIGKTVLWSEAVELARKSGYRVLDCALTERESSLAFAGLADLLRPVLDDVLPKLPEPRARALETALALVRSDQRPPDERAVAFGFHAVISMLAADGPVALAIDDVQWLDPSSTLMLSYAVRRLRREPLLLILAERDGPDADHGNPLTQATGFATERIPVGPLALGAIHRLIRLRLGFSLPRPALLRVHAASEGNPLHALELARAMQASTGTETGSLARLLSDRVTALPERTRLALLLGAISTQRDHASLAAAHGGADLSRDLQPAIEAELVRIVDRSLQFTHPLVATAAEAAAPADTRRELHLVLAALSSAPDARVTHLANATSSPDAGVADALDATARGTRSRGARATSARLFEESARLTPPGDAADRARRLLAAAEGWYEAGDLGVAEGILASLLEELPHGEQRCEAAWRLGVLRDEAGRWQEATTLWREALSQAETPGLAARVQCSLATTAYYTESVAAAVEWGKGAVASAERSSDPLDLARALAINALTLAMSGTAGYERPLQRALEIEASTGEFLGDWSPSAVAAETARHTGDDAGARHHFAALLERAREAGDSNVEQWAAFGLASSEVLAGGFGVASELADVVLDLADQTGQMRIPARSLRGLVDGYLGRFESARALVAEAVDAATAADEASHLFVAQTVLAAIETSAGDLATAARAHAEGRRLATGVGLAHAGALRACLHEVEVAAAVGLNAQAGEAMAAAMSMSKGVIPPWATGLAHRARGAVLAAEGDLPAAQAELEAALATATLPLDRARALLALGLVCRRSRERARARELLQAAIDAFTELGTPPWIERARAEIARIPGRRAGTGGELTDAESRIAQLVVEGRSNREVAAELFLSVKTVEVTLTRVYQKLEIRSRAQLGPRLGAVAKQ
jgi:DNA-binding CsgD family transcriptional regulator